jgi:hypothetical protein
VSSANVAIAVLLVVGRNSEEGQGSQRAVVPVVMMMMMI